MPACVRKAPTGCTGGCTGGQVYESDGMTKAHSVRVWTYGLMRCVTMYNGTPEGVPH